MELAASLARARGIAVLFTEHDMDIVFAHADRIVVLDRGRLVAEGRPEEVRANAGVRAVYLGGTALMLAVRDLHAYYGRAHILRRRLARGRRWRGGGVARPQRRRQVDHPEVHHGAGAAGRRHRELRGPADRAAGALSHRAARAGLRARGTAHLHGAYGHGKSRGRPAAAATRRAGVDREQALRRCFPISPAWALAPAVACRAASSRC